MRKLTKTAAAIAAAQSQAAYDRSNHSSADRRALANRTARLADPTTAAGCAAQLAATAAWLAGNTGR